MAAPALSRNRSAGLGLLLAAALATPPSAAQTAEPVPPAPAPEAPAPSAVPQEAPAESFVEEGTSPLRVLRTGGLRMETAALLMSGQEGGSLPCALLAFPLEQQGERVRVPVLFELDGSALLDEHAGGLLRIDVSIYALTTAGAVQGSLANTVEIDPEQIDEAFGRSGIQFLGELSLLPGEYSLRALAKSPAGNAVGLRVLPLTVPDLKTAERFLLPPLLFPERTDAWMTVPAHEIRNRPSPLAALGREIPQARPILTLDRETQIVLPAFNLGQPPELRLEVRRPAGELAADLPARIADRQPTEIAGLEMVTVSVTPQDVESGPYTIRLVVPGSAPVSAEPKLQVMGTPSILVEGETGGRVWAEFTRSKRDPAAASAGTMAVPTRKRKKVNPAPIEAAYREALRRLASGDEKGARTAVGELEAAALDRDGIDIEDLAKIELGIVQKVAESHRDGMVPILMMHADLYRDYWKNDHFLRSTHARELALLLIDLYVPRDAPAANQKLAARYLLNLGATLSQTTSRGIRERVMRRALDLDKDNALILLCLAVDAEREGEHRLSLEYLDRLLKLRPDLGEARVRVAINNARLGKDREARRMLQEIVAGPDPAPEDEWWLSLAYQELGRSLAQSKDFDGAEKVLRSGIQRRPDDEKLLLQLAALFDLRQRTREAQAVLDAIRPAGAAVKTDSARRRYTLLPAGMLDEDSGELRRKAEASLPSLAAAIKVESPKGGTQ